MEERRRSRAAPTAGTDGLLVTDDRVKAGQLHSRALSAFCTQKNRLYLGEAATNVGGKDAELQGGEGRAGECAAVFGGGTSQAHLDPAPGDRRGAQMEL